MEASLYEWLKVSKAELAVLIELLLRGPQTEGELRARVNRMESLPDLAALQTILEALMPRGLVVYLSPPGQRRGVMLTHGLYPPRSWKRSAWPLPQQQQRPAATRKHRRGSRPHAGNCRPGR